MANLERIRVNGPLSAAYEQVLTAEALQFLATLERAFRRRRQLLLEKREQRQAAIDAGERPTFLDGTRHIRESEWQVAPAPADLQKRWVEITGPTDRKMLINALNSGATCSWPTSRTPTRPPGRTWSRARSTCATLCAGTISFTSPDGKQYRLNDQVATLLVRPRGWHLEERHLCVDGEPVSAALFDFGLYFFHNAQALLDQGSGPYFYLAKLENHLEARLWNEAFVLAQDALGIPRAPSGPRS
jgi:malate synthase